MFDKILDLPAHPLLNHAPVVLVPLLIALAAGYAVLPFWRAKLGWAVVSLAVLAPASVFAARQSGLELRKGIGPDQRPPEWAGEVQDHEEFGTMLLWFSIGLGVAALLLVAAHAAQQRAPEGPTGDGEDVPVTGRRGGRGLAILVVVLGVAVLGLGAATGWYTYQVGHSGAKMVWQDQP